MLNSGKINSSTGTDIMSRGFKISLSFIGLFLLAFSVLMRFGDHHTQCGDLPCTYLNTAPDNLLCISGPTSQFPRAKLVCYSTFYRWELFDYTFGKKNRPSFYVDKDGVRYPAH